ncbi:MAG: hypothetical protein KGL39_24910 [Patescibacteria group bacterium]|nr:hypothetical protein [Patescibacteria group bacterium]
MRHVIIIGLALVMGWGSVRAQTEPDRRGEYVTDTPNSGSVHPNAPIDARWHIRNEGGSNGAGLCVISSVIINGAAQNVADFRLGKESRLWKVAKRRPGGYSPDKLARLLREVYPELKWFSWEGRETDLIRKFSAEGFPVAATMNTGQLYHYMPIHHMISIPHASTKIVCVVDNNDPGKWHWMPAAEYDRRFVDGGAGWLFVLLERPLAPLIGFWLAIVTLTTGAILCYVRGYILCTQRYSLP